MPEAEKLPAKLMPCGTGSQENLQRSRSAMGKPRSREPASEPRRTRRSLVELTEAATRAASDAMPAPGPIASALDEVPPSVAARDQVAVADGPAAARRAAAHRPAHVGGEVSSDARSVETAPPLRPAGPETAHADVAPERTGKRNK